MAFYTNYAGDITDGYEIPIGDKRHLFLRKLIAGILSVSSGEWLEVTGSGPTPSALQTYASTIAAAVTNATNPSQNTYVTIYHATDPEIGSEDSRLIRFVINDVDSSTDWLKIEIMDTAAAEEWTAIDTSLTTQGSSNAHGMGYAASTSAALTAAQRVFVFGDDEWMGFAIYDAVQGWTHQANWFMVPSAIDGFDRGALAYFYGAIAIDSNLTGIGNVGMVTCASGSAASGSNQILVSQLGDLDTPSELILSEDSSAAMARLSVIQNTTFLSFVSTLPRIRVIRTDLAIDMLQFDVAADSTQWLALCTASGSTSTVHWCVDITPEA